MTDSKNIGLILEGGGMRGVFTCGVLDYFMVSDCTTTYFKTEN
jgi:predicted patatin/cPLA2 family phospholipase